MLTAFQLDAFQTCAFQEEANAGTPATPQKVGGDDVPREEYWEKRKKRRNKDAELQQTIEAAYRKILGSDPPPEIVAEVKAEVIAATPEPVAVRSDPSFDAWIEAQRVLIDRLLWEMREREDEEALLLLM